MRRLITLSVLALLIGLTVYQASAATERSSPATLPKGGTERGVAAFPTGTWNTAINVQNPTTSTATVQVKFYKSDGTLAYTAPSDTIAAGGSKTYYLPDLTDLADGKYSGVVESDQAVVAVVTETSYSGKGIGDAYNGITAGATQLNVPVVYRGYSNWDTMVAIQNTDASATASVALNFFKAGEATATLRSTDTIPALSSKTYDLSSAGFSTLGAGFLGSLTITSTTNVAAVAHGAKQTAGYDVLNIFRGVTSGATSYFAPVVYNQFSPSTTNGWTSAINIANLASTADTITMDFTLDPRSGQTGTFTVSKPIAANSFAYFYLPDHTGGAAPNNIPTGVYGSAIIRSGGNQIAVIATATKYATGVATAYNAFPSTAGSKRVVSPVLYNQFNPSNTLGWTSAINVQNLGSAADTVTMNFTLDARSGQTGTFSWSQPVSANGAVTFYLPDANGTSGRPNVPLGVYGVAEVTSTSQNILAVVTNTNYNRSFATAFVGVNE